MHSDQGVLTTLLGQIEGGHATTPTPAPSFVTCASGEAVMVTVIRTGLTTNIFIPGLYWAVGRMLRAALADQPTRCQTAEQLLRSFPRPTSLIEVPRRTLIAAAPSAAGLGDGTHSPLFAPLRSKKRSTASSNGVRSEQAKRPSSILAGSSS
jgi:hypothetical protein